MVSGGSGNRTLCLMVLHIRMFHCKVFEPSPSAFSKAQNAYLEGEEMKNAKTTVAALLLGLAITVSAAAEDRMLDYQVLSTSRTSTMEKELNQAAAAGYRFVKMSNSSNIFGGKELVVVTVKNPEGDAPETRQYKVLSARGTSKLQEQLKEA